MDTKKLDFNKKNAMIQLAGSCFWFWNTFYYFLNSCGLAPSAYEQFGKSVGKYQVMRSLLELLERQERHDLILNIATGFYNLKLSEDGIDLKKAKQLLDEFRKSTGETLVETEAEKKEQVRRITEQKKMFEEKQVRSRRIVELKNVYTQLSCSSDKQKRGYDIESLFFDLLSIEEFENTKPFRNPGEQIDGHFKYEKFDYLVEIKWTQDTAKQEDLSVFDGKIRGKAQSTRGLFLSINGFDSQAVLKYKTDSPRIILMDGQDLFIVLDERTTFYDLMKYKVDQLVRKGEVYAKFNGA
ncbi:MAG: hypothetical protein WC527_02810 [Candidatus Margulisiibacteriota bacterium]